eukprot:TRINITY_DN38365_c0_g1_i1.p1 TRINITY_DN38365_c0_g1~~TRINITY_DN38365_c0_g1_i1.p1  ORF type:complete len:343 (+),score=33.00 TRINITY_DN38365_c0_g1_i1:145-1173(+)
MPTLVGRVVQCPFYVRERAVGGQTLLQNLPSAGPHQRRTKSKHICSRSSLVRSCRTSQNINFSHGSVSACQLPGKSSATSSATITDWNSGKVFQIFPALSGVRNRVVPSVTAATASGGAAGSAEGAQSALAGFVAVIDNYDSFTYNLCQYLGDLGCEHRVFRNDEITVQELERLRPLGVLISPGPGTPEEAGISMEVLRELGPRGMPVFGVCMGLQCMGQAFGGNVVRAPGGVMHGKTSQIFHHGAADGLLAGMSNPFTACRYHSLVIDRETFPSNELEITAWTADNLVMGVRHKRYRQMEGVQFHPESIISADGKRIVENFVRSLSPSKPQAKRELASSGQ